MKKEGELDAKTDQCNIYENATRPSSPHRTLLGSPQRSHQISSFTATTQVADANSATMVSSLKEEPKQVKQENVRLANAF